MRLDQTKFSLAGDCVHPVSKNYFEPQGDQVNFAIWVATGLKSPGTEKLHS